MTVLNILMQNPDATFETVVGNTVTLKTDADREDTEGAVEVPPETPKKTFTIDDIEF